jgi:hypothetical protein
MAQRWLVDMARKVTETKIGGVWGFGSEVAIDEKEQAAIAELAAFYFLLSGSHFDFSRNLSTVAGKLNKLAS